MKKIKYSDILDKLLSVSLNAESSISRNSVFKNINSIFNAGIDDLAFFSNVKYISQLKITKAKACLIKKDYINYLPKNCSPIIVDDPYLVFAKLTELFFDDLNTSNGNISDKAFIHKDTKLNNNIQIDPFCFIDTNTEIMDNVVIRSNTRLGPNVIIHKNCMIHDNVSIANSIIYENCEIQSGAKIGGSGFGFEEKTKQKIYHHGKVKIHKNSTIGSNTTVDRAVFDSTEIGEFSQIDNLVQIAHNVTIGKHAIIAAQVGIAGSTSIGDNVKIGGQSGISGHLKIGNNVTIAGKSGVTKNIKDNMIVAGFPAKDINIWKREIINISKKR